MKSEMVLSVSIIVAAHNGKRELLACLSAISEQNSFGKLAKYEIIVVGCLDYDTKTYIEEKHPNVKIISVSEPLPVPGLRSIGIKASKGDVVALLEDHCVPAKDWVQSILNYHQKGYFVVGGAVENGLSEQIIDWAVYFFEYSSFMNPVPKGNTNLLPGNNVSYKRSALQTIEDMLEQNLWESYWHKRLIKRGVFLMSAPDMIVYHMRSFSLTKFWHISFLHGCNHSIPRYYNSCLHKFSWSILAVFLPFALTCKVGKRIFYKQRHFSQFFIASPVIFLFYIAWTVGELVGTFSGQAIKDTGWGE